MLHFYIFSNCAVYNCSHCSCVALHQPDKFDIYIVYALYIQSAEFFFGVHTLECTTQSPLSIIIVIGYTTHRLITIMLGIYMIMCMLRNQVNFNVLSKQNWSRDLQTARLYPHKKISWHFGRVIKTHLISEWVKRCMG